MAKPVRIMRRNYDKPHRCPGWSGPAFRGGYLDVDADLCAYLGPRKLDGAGLRNGPAPWNSYGLVRCPGCRTWVLPVWARWLDPSYLAWRARP